MFDYRPTFGRRRPWIGLDRWCATLLFVLALAAWFVPWRAAADPWARADAAWRLGLTEQSLNEYRRAVAAYPHDRELPMAEYRIARCLERLGQYDEAERAYEMFLRDHPEHPLRGAVEAQLEVYPVAFVEP